MRVAANGESGEPDAMTSRYHGPSAARLRAQRVRAAWAQLVAVIREEQVKPLYCGPDARAIEAIGEEALAQVDDILFEWLASIAALPRAKTAGAKLRAALGRR